MAGYVIPEAICLYLPYILGKIRPSTQYQDQSGMFKSGEESNTLHT